MADQIDIEAELEPGFQLLAEEAERAGHPPMLVARALLSLARNRMAMLNANGATDRQIAAARKARSR